MKIWSMVRRMLILLLTLCLWIPSTAYGAAGDDPLNNVSKCKSWPKGPKVESGAAILVDADTGSILYAKNADKTCFPASITKVMTALMVLENCELDETVTFSYRATHELEAGSTHIARTEGEEMTVEQCLYALMLVSANEVAQALAEHVSGSIEDFVVLMNQRAEELGCTNTHFKNPSGLNDSNHYTTCHDMAVILQEACRHPEFMEIESHTTYTIPATNKHSDETLLAQKHALVKDGADHYEGALAGKTGYTTIAGNTLVTYARRSNQSLICVVMESAGTHYKDTRTLFDHGFDNFSNIQLSKTNAAENMVSALRDAGSALSEEELERAVVSDDQILTLPDDFEFSALKYTTEILSGAALEVGGDPAVAAIHYSYKKTSLGSAVLTIPPAPAVPETETETEENASDLSDSAILTRLRALYDKGAAFVADLLTFRRVKALYAEFGSFLIVAAVAMVVFIILLILLLRSIFGGGRRRNTGYYGNIGNSSGSLNFGGGGHGRRSRRRRDKNKYHW